MLIGIKVVPKRGTGSSKAWNGQFQSAERTVPKRGTDRSKPWNQPGYYSKTLTVGMSCSVVQSRCNLPLLRTTS